METWHAPPGMIPDWADCDDASWALNEPARVADVALVRGGADGGAPREHRAVCGQSHVREQSGVPSPIENDA